MIAYRIFPLDSSASDAQPGGALWWPRGVQGTGRHDNPDHYACIYASESEVSAISEAFAPFRGTGSLTPDMLRRAGLPLAIAELELPDDADVVDLDDPRTLVAEGLRPSRVATARRALTQADAARMFDAHPAALALRWWSTLEGLWPNVTLFDRARAHLRLVETRTLSFETAAVRDAADFLGLALP